MSEYASRFDFYSHEIRNCLIFLPFLFFFFQMTSTWKMRDKYGMDGKFDWKG